MRKVLGGGNDPDTISSTGIKAALLILAFWIFPTSPALPRGGLPLKHSEASCLKLRVLMCLFSVVAGSCLPTF